MVKRIGEHTVRLGNVMDGLEELMGGDRADLIYSDPPWGQGNLNYWQTINAKMTGAPRETFVLGEFLERTVEIVARYARGYVIMEYGVRWADEFVGRAKGAGLQYHDTLEHRYKASGQDLPFHLHLFSAPGKPPKRLSVSPAVRGLKTVREAAEPFLVPGGILLDPCCGVGFMAQVAADGGMRFRGNEINAARLAKTIARLERSAVLAET